MQHAEAVARVLSDGERAADLGNWETALALAGTALHLGSADERATSLRRRAAQALTRSPAAPHVQHRGTVELLSARVQNLTPLPAIAARVLSLSNDHATSASDLAKWISSDPALTASVLRLANSPFFHRSRHVGNVKEAVVLVGFREVRSIAVTASLLDSMKPAQAVNSHEYWRFALTVGVLAELQAVITGVGRELAFTAGVVHNIGLLALDIADPPGLRLVLESDAIEGMRRLEDRELRVFGFTSANLGAHLAAAWGFPASLVEVIATHNVRVSELPSCGPLTQYVVNGRVFARTSGLSDGFERSEARRVPDELSSSSLGSAVEQMGGLRGITERVDRLISTHRADAPLPEESDSSF